MLSPASPLGPVEALDASTLPSPIADAARALVGEEPQAAFFYLPSVAAARGRALRAALPDWADLAFAVKANSFSPVLESLGAVVDALEISSAGELDLALSTARQLGRPLGLLASGPGKTPSLIAALIEAGADPINVESTLELERVAHAARHLGRRARVAIRVNPDQTPLVGVLQMGGTSSQFGVSETDVPSVLALARRHREVEVVGFHFHAVSGNLDASAHVSYVGWCIDWCVAMASAHRLDLRVIDVGGGLGVPFDGGAAFDLDSFAVGLEALRPPAGTRVIFEPGRWLAAPCGWYAAPVTDLKRSRDEWFAIVRGGIHHFALPASWNLLHNVCVVPVEEWHGGGTRPELKRASTNVVGELCTPEDVLARNVGVGRLRAGDVLVFPNAGSYGWEFALQRFLGHPPARRLVVGDTPAKEN